nr:DUF2247 family protein [Acinetobacter sp. Marseille-Q1620]
MNFSINIPIKILSFFKLTWAELYWAYQKEWLKHETILLYAEMNLSEKSLYFENELDLVLCGEKIWLGDFDKKIEALSRFDAELNTDKWLYIVVYYCYQKFDTEDLPEIIEKIYEEFQYCEELMHCISYMPALESDQKNKEYIAANFQETIKFKIEEYLVKYQDQFMEQKL